MDEKIWTVKEVINWTTNYLESKGLPNARLDIEYLLSYILGVSRLNLYLQMDKPLNKRELSLFKSMVKRRLNREPVQYITNRAYIWKYEFFVDKGVFIPRKETETLIEVSLSSLKKKENPFVLDVGCGCGCVILSIVKDLPGAKGIGIDIDAKAVKVSAINRKRLNLTERVYFVQSDLFCCFKQAEIFDAIVSNPPYISSDDIESLQEEIAKYEPRIALNGGKDGLAIIRRIVKGAFYLIKRGGFLALEVGIGQGASVKFFMERAGFVKVSVEKDFSGVDRVVIGWKP